MLGSGSERTLIAVAFVLQCIRREVDRVLYITITYTRRTVMHRGQIGVCGIFSVAKTCMDSEGSEPIELEWSVCLEEARRAHLSVHLLK